MKEAQSSDEEDEEERGVDELLTAVIDEVSIGTVQVDCTTTLPSAIVYDTVNIVYIH